MEWTVALPIHTNIVGLQMTFARHSHLTCMFPMMKSTDSVNYEYCLIQSYTATHVGFTCKCEPEGCESVYLDFSRCAINGEIDLELCDISTDIST